MPNHLYLVLYTGNEEATINTWLANGKRFLTYEIVKRLENKGNIEMVRQLAEAVTTGEKNRKKSTGF